MVPLTSTFFAAFHLTFFAAHNSLEIRFAIILQFIEESSKQKAHLCHDIHVFVWWPRLCIVYAIESMLIVGASKRTFDDDSHKQSVNKIKWEKTKTHETNTVIRRYLFLLFCETNTMA